MPTLRILVGENDNDTSSIDLLEGGDGYKLRLDGWEPQLPSDNGSDYDDVIETITIKAVGSSRENLSDKITDDIDKTINYIRKRINDPVAPDLVYLIWTWSLSGASRVNERRALIKKISYSVNHTPYFPPIASQSTILNLTLTIQRSPYWEQIASAQANALGLLSGGDSQEVIGTSRKGSATGRISVIRIDGTSLSEYWTGFRTDKYGAREYFQPVWPFDTVLTYNDATTSSSNSADGAVNTVVWNSGDSDLLERMTITMNQVDDIKYVRSQQRGTFTVLLRARSTGTETFNARLSSGFSYGGNWNTHSRVKISGTGFLFYPMGTITIPPLGLRSTSYTNTILIDFGLRLEVEVNTSGTGNFEATRFVLIPQDEGYTHIKGVNTGGLSNTFIINEIDGRWSSYVYWPTLERTETPELFDVVNYFVPNDDFRVVFAGHGTSQSLSPSSTVTYRMTYHPRYIGVGEKRG